LLRAQAAYERAAALLDQMRAMVDGLRRRWPEGRPTLRPLLAEGEGSDRSVG